MKFGKSLRLMLGILMLVLVLEAKAQIKLIHSDADDIKKHNVSIMMSVRPLIGIGPQLRYTYYPASRIRLLYNFYYPMVGNPEKGYYSDYSKRDVYRPDAKRKGAMIHEFELDFHLIDFHKKKDINVALAWGATANTRTLDYTTVPGEVRRILAFTGGTQYIKRNELLNGRVNHGYEVYNISAASNEFIREKVYTNTSYLNMLFGFKFKSISANGTKSDWGVKYNDMHLETYATLIVPIAHQFQAGVFKDPYDYDLTPSHNVLDRKVKPGFKFGVFHRNSIKNYWSIGAEIGRYPTMAARVGAGMFFNLSMGLSLNFGKIKTID
jgi:hypothetical protein